MPDAEDVGGCDAYLAVWGLVVLVQGGSYIMRIMVIHCMILCQAPSTAGVGGPLKGDLYHSEYLNRLSSKSVSMASRTGAG